MAPPGHASAILDLLTKDDAHTIEIVQTKLAYPIRFVDRFSGDLGPLVDKLIVVGVDVSYPLKQMNTTGTRIVLYEVNAELSRQTTAYVSAP